MDNESAELVVKAPSPGWKQRLATLTFPPLGLWMVWTSASSFARKIFGTLFIAVYSVLYVAGCAAVLLKIDYLHLEWRGRGIPSLTHTPVRTDYDQLEQHRQRQSGQGTITNLSGGIYWTGFRGPRHDGHYTEQPIRTDWDSNAPELRWKQPCGGGYGSFAIANGVAFTIEQRREKEAVVAYDLKIGWELWVNDWEARFFEQMGGEGPRTSPAYHDGKVYALGGRGEFRCIDAKTGESIWRHDVVGENGCKVLYFGCGASPLVFDDKVLVFTGVPTGADAKGVVAYHKDTGDVVWRAIDEQIGYASPAVAEILGDRQLLVFSANYFRGLNPENGEEMWKFPWNDQHDNSIAQPVIVSSNRVFISAGYGKGCAMLEISRTDGKWSAEELWKNIFMKNKLSSSVLHDGYLYGLDEDRLVCMDPETGRKQWKDGRYGYGQIILAAGHIVVACGDGDLALVKCNPNQHEEVTRFSVLGGKTWNHPALADGMLLMRNAATMACFNVSTITAYGTR